MVSIHHSLSMYVTPTARTCQNKKPQPLYVQIGKKKEIAFGFWFLAEKELELDSSGAAENIQPVVLHSFRKKIRSQGKSKHYTRMGSNQGDGAETERYIYNLCFHFLLKNKY